MEFNADESKHIILISDELIEFGIGRANGIEKGVNKS